MRPPLGVVSQMAEVTRTSSRQRWTLVLVCTAAFMLLLDITIVSVALPSIQRDLRASLPDLQWVSAAYALVLAVLLLPAATLGDRLGQRRLFLAGLVIFTAAGLVNTLRQVGTATGVAVLGAVYASRITAATLHALAGLPAPPGAARRLAAAVASGTGTRVAAVVPPAARGAVTHAARAGTASGLNDVLLAAAAFAVLGAIAGFAFGPDPARQPPPPSSVPGELSAQPTPAQRPAEPETTAP